MKAHAIAVTILGVLLLGGTVFTASGATESAADHGGSGWADERSPATPETSGETLTEAQSSVRSMGDGYAACSTTDNCYSFDLTTYAPGPSITILPEGDYPYDATMNPSGTEVWIVGASGDGVAIVDRATNTVTHRVSVADYDNSVVFTDDGSLALVSSRDDDIVTLIDTGTYTVTGTLDVTTGGGGFYDGPGNMALDPVSKNIYAVDWHGDTLFEIAPDGSEVLDSVSVGDGLWQLVIPPDGLYVYITDRTTDQVRVVDRETLTQIHAVSVGDDPWGIDITLDGSKLVVCCEDTYDAYIIETGTWLVTPVFLGGKPRDVDILDRDGLAFIAGGSTGTESPVYVLDLDTASVLTTITGPGTNVNVVAVQRQMSSASTGIENVSVSREDVALASYPNPFNPRTWIRYAVDSPEEMELAVFSVAGRHITTLDRGHRDAGSYVATWNGRDSRGNAVGSGVYLVRLSAGDSVRTVKAVLLR
jgi:YVTN family beta-propeller protein